MPRKPTNYAGPLWPPGTVLQGLGLRIVRVIGRGGMAVVYEVERLGAGERYALKVLSAHLADRIDLIARFLREADALRVLTTAPNVVQLYDAGFFENNQPYLLLELLHGRTLREVLMQGRPPMGLGCYYVTQLLWGLAPLHLAKCVHRDVKPENFFIQDDGSCKLLDFGLIKVALESPVPPGFITGPGGVFGTSSYMAPEYNTSRLPDARADIFSAGVVLVEVLLGRRPLAHLSDDELQARIMTRGFPSIEEAGGHDVPFELRAIANRATAKRPSDRYPTAVDCASDLVRALRHLRLLPPWALSSAAWRQAPPPAGSRSVGAPPAAAAPRTPLPSLVPMSQRRTLDLGGGLLVPLLALPSPAGSPEGEPASSPAPPPADAPPSSLAPPPAGTPPSSLAPTPADAPPSSPAPPLAGEPTSAATSSSPVAAPGAAPEASSPAEAPVAAPVGSMPDAASTPVAASVPAAAPAPAMPASTPEAAPSGAAHPPLHLVRTSLTPPRWRSPTPPRRSLVKALVPRLEDFVARLFDLVTPVQAARRAERAKLYRLEARKARQVGEAAPSSHQPVSSPVTPPSPSGFARSTIVAVAVSALGLGALSFSLLRVQRARVRGVSAARQAEGLPSVDAAQPRPSARASIAPSAPPAPASVPAPSASGAAPTTAPGGAAAASARAPSLPGAASNRPKPAATPSQAPRPGEGRAAGAAERPAASAPGAVFAPKRRLSLPKLALCRPGQAPAGHGGSVSRRPLRRRRRPGARGPPVDAARRLVPPGCRLVRRAGRLVGGRGRGPSAGASLRAMTMLSPSFRRALALTLSVAAPAMARPSAPAQFCARYPSAPACAGGQAACGQCHFDPPARNEYGAEVAAALAPGSPRPLPDDVFAAGLAEALAAVEGLDADGDGVANVAEIEAGSSPSDPSSRPAEGCDPALESEGFRLCGYDLRYAFRKVHLDFCGRSATFDENESFARAADPKAELHAALDRCLRGEAWRGKDGALWRLAHRKIRPNQSIKSGEGAGPVPLADYDDDYAFYVYSQIDGHDARDLLVGTYFVARDPGPPTTYAPFDRDVFSDALARGEDVAQLVDRDRRAGMLTHRWFLMTFTMFTPVPRTTAAQAYRAYLGLDLALMQGLSAVPGEPADHDRKGVGAPACATCHATLDPLSYPFSRYEGLDSDAKSFVDVFTQYRPDRLARFVETDGPGVVATPEAGVLFGQPVADLVEWARVAAESDEFAQTLVRDHWERALGGPPGPSEQAAFAQLWRRLRTEHGYRIDPMLHELIDTEAYGVPLPASLAGFALVAPRPRGPRLRRRRGAPGRGPAARRLGAYRPARAGTLPRPRALRRRPLGGARGARRRALPRVRPLRLRGGARGHARGHRALPEQHLRALGPALGQRGRGERAARPVGVRGAGGARLRRPRGGLDLRPARPRRRGRGGAAGRGARPVPAARAARGEPRRSRGAGVHRPRARGRARLRGRRLPGPRHLP
ncbi:MAG TPA: serine/threonine-protein kinase [Polyangiaceae bacterium]|nr:serine/threonine-protein kinase [Polyangiaceae bacterium]